MASNSSNDPVASQITAWKESLIDLTRRNPLLSLSLKAKTNLRLSDIAPDDVFQTLSRRRKSLLFVPEGSEEQAPLFPSTRPRKPGVLPMPEASMKVLNTLRQRSVLTLQEQGVNTLFVAVGLLEWFDSKTRATLLSPLLLLPVVLERTPGDDTLRLRRIEDDVEVNPTLSYRLSQKDLMTTLPDLPEEDKLLPSAYLKEVEAAVQGFQDWHVHRQCYIGRFSFLKLVMYRDLEAMAEAARQHPVVAAMAGDRAALQRLPAVAVPEGNVLDETTQQRETFQALDADPSQQRAIFAARQGQSFVLQGPPGTGKTQTIANIIMECIAAGKRVLFVSQKMAALDAVFKRLRDKGLADLCLEAHSYKANKKDVLEQLRKALTGKAAPENRQGQLLGELAESRQLLNDVAAELHRTHEPLRVSLYEANGRVALASHVPDLPFVFVAPETVTAEEFRRLETLAEQLASYQELFSESESHPWRGVLVKRFSLDLQTQVRTLLNNLLQELEKLERQAAEIGRLCGATGAVGISGTDWLLQVAATLEKTPRPPADWLTGNSLADLQRTAAVSRQRHEDFSAARAHLLTLYSEAIFSLPHTDLKARLLERHQDSLRPALGDSWSSKAAGDGETILRLLDTLTANTERVRRAQSALAPLCGLTSEPSTDTLGFCRYLLHIADQTSKDPKPTRAWFASGVMPELMRRTEEAERQHAGLLTKRAALMERYEEQLFQLDLPRLHACFQNEYASVWRFFKPAYYRDRRLVWTVVKPDMPKPADLGRDLSLACEVRQHEEWIRTNERDLASTFGRHYRGLQTDWQALRDALRSVEALADAFSSREVPERLQACLIASGPDIQALTDLQQQLKRHWTALGQDFEQLKKWRASEDLPFTDKPLAQAPLEELRNWLGGVRSALADHCEARGTVLRAQRVSVPPRSAEKLADDVVEAARVTAEADAIQAEADTLHTLYGPFYRGIATDWTHLLAALEWARHLRELFREHSVPENVVSLAVIGDAAVLAGIASAREQLAASRSAWSPLYAELGGLFPPERLQAAGRSLMQAPSAAVFDWLHVRQTRLPDLEQWIDFQNLRETCADRGMLSFFDTTIHRVPPPEQVVPAFQKRFYRLWIDSVSDTVPLLRQFRGEQHATRIARFAALDLHQINTAPDRVRALAHSRKPGALSNFGEIGALRTQLSRKRPKAIRKLLADIPNLLFALKPCLLMSPLSVSLFLDPEKISFDLVIFDEASQIFVQDAVGALLRGRQAIIAGDTKQLPPTSFFLNMQEESVDEDDEETPGADEFESVLKAADALALERSPYFAQHPLEWHYRSQHEALIAFSRKHFYERLITFPSAALQSAVTFKHVPQGIYYGGKGNRRNNPVEARRVAELVVAHVRAHPDLSAGVITFSAAQQRTVEEEIDVCKRQSPDLEALLSEEGSEGFFIKNIENVQGDERDVIFLSIGYGRDLTGSVYMRFGPLNKEGGERRLNVAISRARQRCTVVSSLLPQDIVSDKLGPKLLRAYLEFARQGDDGAGAFLADFPQEQSDFERAVQKALESRGHRVRQQVGLFDYRMDLAVVDPEDTDRYLLGIECDGLMYRNAETARARDRLRPAVLQALGWRLLRLWSSDWVRNPEGELARIEESIQRARKGEDITPPIETISAWAPQDGSVPDVPSTGTDAPASSFTGIPPGVVYYERAQIALPGASEALYDEDDQRRISFLTSLVEQESPVALETAIQRLAEASGLARAGSRVRSIIEDTTEEMARREMIEVRDKFLWTCHSDNPVPRVPRDSDVPRPLDQICLEEIGELVVALLKVAFGVRREELITETARMLGYRNTGANIRDRINESLSLMELDNRIHVQGGQVRALEL